jgi:O-Antigen ligase
MLLPGALTVYLGFRSGGLHLGTTGLAAAAMALAMALRFALARRPLAGLGAPLIVAVVAMAGLAGWTLLSSEWSDSAARTYPGYSRALFYGLVLLFFGSIPFEARRVRWMTYGLAAAIAVICGAAMTARLLPEVIFDVSLVSETRLAYPLTYWNALGMIACVGVVLCGHLACSTRDHPAARVLGAAAIPLLTLTLLYALVGRPRGLLSGALAAIPAAGVALVAAHPASAVTDGYPSQMADSGQELAVVLVACMLGAALLRALLLPLDAWVVGLRPPGRDRRPLLTGAAVAGLVLVAAAGAVAGVPGELSAKYGEFTDREHTDPETRDESRLLSGRSQGRFDLWEVALDSYREDHLKGTGAGSYEEWWNRLRPTPTTADNAHSVYLEALGELGIVGLVLLVVALGLILGAFAYRARGPDRALFAALLSAGLAWAIHAGVDWDWRMPTATLWLFALGGAALARPLRRPPRSGGPEIALLRVGGVLVCLVLALLPARLAFSDARLRDAIEAANRRDCVAARAAAASSSDAISERPTPYQVVAFCDLLEGRYRHEVTQMSEALARDPDNWELSYGLALAQAAAGQDPRPALRRTFALNPREPLLQHVPAVLLSPRRSAWKQAVGEAPLVQPGFADP